MSIIVSGLISAIGTTQEEIIQKAALKLGKAKEHITLATIAKSSVDARKGDIKFVSSVAFELNCDEKKLVESIKDNTVTYKEAAKLSLTPGALPLSARPVIAGFGPAGMFAALVLARLGYRPIVLERGGDVDARVHAVEGFWRGGVLDPDCNVQYGEGGAGTFSDGKLTTRIGDPRCRYVLEELVAHGAPQAVLMQAKPHIGTDQLRGIVKAIRQEICALGGEVLFRQKLTGLTQSGGKLIGVKTDRGELPAGALVTAIGHSARDTFEVLAACGLPMESKAFSVGVRIEHLQSDIDKGLYGKHAGHPKLPVGEYQLSYREGERAAYTFCMCPGGTVVASSSEEGGVVTNGMSEYARDLANANSALVVSVSPDDFGASWREGIRFQRSLERAAFVAGGSSYRAPAQTVGAFLGSTGSRISARVKPSYQLGVEETSLKEVLPPVVSEMITKTLPIFGRRLPGFDAHDSVLTGVETRTSSPVRILRGEDLCSIALDGLYPCGEGAGYAGGIMSAAVDGIRVAEAIISRYCPSKA